MGTIPGIGGGGGTSYRFQRDGEYRKYRVQEQGGRVGLSESCV